MSVRRRQTAQTTALVWLLGAIVFTGGAVASNAQPGHTCSKYASITGNDHARGTVGAPFRTIRKLLATLGPGQEGCLRAGVYSENVTFQAPSVTLTSAPGEMATIRGRVYIPRGRTDETLADVAVDGSAISESVVVQVFADGFRLGNSNVTAEEHDHICVLIGGGARDVVIEGNRIFGCGVPGKSDHVHGIYVQDADGTQIVGNDIYDNQSGWGIQFWTNGDDALVANNVLDGNSGGIIIGGCNSLSEQNTIRDNVITNSGGHGGVTSYWCSAVGSGNVVSSNCIVDNSPVDVGRQVGFTAAGTVAADPEYVNRAAKNFTLQAGSPCTGKGPDVTVGPTVVTPVSQIGSSVPTSGSSAPGPEIKTLPTIKGVRSIGGTLRATSGTWSGSPRSFTYQWVQCSSDGASCSLIGGATSRAHRVVRRDLGWSLSVVVTAANQAGSAHAQAALVSVLPAKT